MRGRKKESGEEEGRNLLLSSGSFNMALSRANCALKENAEGEGNENVPSYQNEMRGFLTFPLLFPAVDALKMANKVELPYRVLGTAPKEIDFVPVLTSSKHRCKRNFTVVFVQVVKKSALDVQNLFFFIYLLGSVMNSNTF